MHRMNLGANLRVFSDVSFGVLFSALPRHEWTGQHPASLTEKDSDNVHHSPILPSLLIVS
jgi:hypothetical protein